MAIVAKICPRCYSRSASRKHSKQAILEWIRELTPQDVADFKFVPDQTGKILVSLVESGGQETSAYSASDGTLRFLGDDCRDAGT